MKLPKAQVPKDLRREHAEAETALQEQCKVAELVVSHQVITNSTLDKIIRKSKHHN